ncbi:rho GTPase-activating protein REN1 [Cornus florida]|uniref:rho GTPase-activating protein REN1 n=1 Tax=Cornus florida TaxID=4283 RepID=UPI0028963CC8|nr:rho GTPase-activating protein REN1 [Cornus florida]
MSGFDLMTTRNTEPSQGDGVHSQAHPGPLDHQRSVGANKSDGGHPPAPPGQSGPPDQRARGGNKVYKSGPLFISSKGIGWTSWKKRWFILTRTSLVFFRSDPSAIPQKESEVNLTLGGIDLNNSGSVDVKADKKLLTVLFPDGRDGRAFTLKAETLEDLFEWKTALEEALAQAPSTALVMGQTAILKNDKTDTADDSSEQLKDKQSVKPLVIGRPILLALEDIDGTPSFLEKALRFTEVHGVKVEGVLRQAADVDDVERRVREYEQGKCEFSPQEDAHVIADCVKYVIRELPSSPVPASCCNALVEACRTDRGMRVTAMRSAICETFPEPNRRLLQRILLMMQTVASHKAENRMSSSAVAACMAPLLLRPLLAGDCELENDFNVGGDGSVQLLQAAAAANHAQAIVVTLLEEYDNIFGEGSMSPEPYTDSEVSGSESEELSDDDETFEDDEAMGGSDASVDDDLEHASRRTCNQAGHAGDDDMHDNKMQSSDPEERSKSATISNEPEHIVRRPAAWGRSSAKKNLSMESVDSTGDEDEIQRHEDTKIDFQSRISEEAQGNAILQESLERRKKFLHERHLAFEQDVARLQDQLQKERELKAVLEAKMSHGPLFSSSTINEKMKAELHEIGQVEADLVNLQQKADYLEVQLNHQREYNYSFMHVSCYQPQQNHQAKLKDEEDIEFVATSRTPERSTRNKGAGGSASSTTSALSKLTNRLNFLKERRTQITNELQNLDKGRNSGQPVQIVERGQGSESRGSSGQSSERGRGFDSGQSLQNQEKCAATEGQLVQNTETVRKSDGQSLQNLDKCRRSESVTVALDKGKSESFPSASKGREGQSRMQTPRTYSR